MLPLLVIMFVHSKKKHTFERNRLTIKFLWGKFALLFIDNKSIQKLSYIAGVGHYIDHDISHSSDDLLNYISVPTLIMSLSLMCVNYVGKYDGGIHIPLKAQYIAG